MVSLELFLKLDLAMQSMLAYQPQLLFLKKKKKAEGKPKNDLLRGEPVSPLQVTSPHLPPLYLENVLFS